jgi:membrane carboxypeptidase/penicillin-binding protein PbpC
MLWRALVALHLSEQTQIALIAARAPMGEHVRGFAAAAEARFGRPLGRLDVRDLATLVAVSQAPSASEASLARRRDGLLLRLQEKAQ